MPQSLENNDATKIPCTTLYLKMEFSPNLDLLPAILSTCNGLKSPDN